MIVVGKHSIPATKKLFNRFWSKVDIRQPDECWPWLGGKTKGGYGSFAVAKIDGRTIRTTSHRVAMMSRGKKIPAKHYGCHSCDNPACCNLRHLFVDTPTGNQADCIAKKRRPNGASHHKAILTSAQVTEIKNRRRAGVPIAEVAKAHNISIAQVSRIANNKRWKNHE